MREALRVDSWSGHDGFCASSLQVHAGLAALHERYRLAVLLDAGHRQTMARLSKVEDSSSRLVADLLLRDVPNHVDEHSWKQLEAHAARLSLHQLVA